MSAARLSRPQVSACWPLGRRRRRKLGPDAGAAPWLRRGFPPAIVELKRAMGEAAPGLKPENPGSRWPKTSLGALGDRARLTPEQLGRLNAICRCDQGPGLGFKAAENQGLRLGLRALGSRPAAGAA